MAKVGGPRSGAGRKPGSKNKLTLEREKAMHEASKKISAALQEDGTPVFDGGPFELLMGIVKDINQPITLRQDSAKALMPYIMPRLQSVSHTLGSNHPESGDTAAERVSRVAAEVAAILQPPPNDSPPLHIVKGSAQ